MTSSQRIAALEAKVAALQDHFWSFVKDRRDKAAQLEMNLSHELREMRDESLCDHLSTTGDFGPTVAKKPKGRK